MKQYRGRIMKNKQTGKGSVSFLGLLVLVFITLKLTNFITWSWWWVLSPLWIGPAAFIAILGIAFTAGILDVFFRGK